MATTYVWTISALDTAPSEGGLIDVIKVCHWRYGADDGTFAVDVYGAQGFDAPDPAAFTPFADVTEAALIGWLQAAIGEDRIAELTAALDRQMVEKHTPAIVTRAAPWLAT